MSNRSWKLIVAGLALAGGLAGSAGPARAQMAPTAPTETSLADLLAGTAVPHAVKLKDLTPEWRRLTLAGETMLGMGGMMQSMMQGIGSMLGGGAGSDALYTRGAVLKIGDQLFLVGYRLPSQGLDLGAIMAMGAGAMGGAGAAGGAAPGGPPKMPPPKPITADSELSLVLVNVRSIASISEIRPFNLQEAMRGPQGGLLDMMPKPGEQAPKPAPAKPAAPPPTKK